MFILLSVNLRLHYLRNMCPKWRLDNTWQLTFTGILLILTTDSSWCFTMTSGSYLVPSVKSVLRSSTSRPHSLRLTLTQFLNVLAWIWIHSSSRPRMCILLAAWPSGDLAARPARSASDIRRVSTVILFPVPVHVSRVTKFASHGTLQYQSTSLIASLNTGKSSESQKHLLSSHFANPDVFH